MKQVSLENIQQAAKKLANTDKDWHFHILTPECQLNDQPKYALILENTSENQFLVHYSDEPAMDVGQQLVKLLHGDDVVGDTGVEESQSTPSSDKVKTILDKAEKMNQTGQFWHHHMLFPECKFNRHQGRWTIIFEDQDTGEVLESVSEDEPKSDLKLIKSLFYQQEK